LLKRDVVGVDISTEAVKAAAAAFGPHFMTAGDPDIHLRAPYDVIYHVGSIGCVADPMGMTRELVGMLKSGGRLLFNSPNRDACSLRGQLWLESAPPPDLVTLFRPGFWRQNFQDIADVIEQVEYDPPAQNFIMGLRGLAGRRWKMPQPICLSNDTQPAPAPETWNDVIWKNIERVARRVGKWTGVNRLAPAHPSEYGLLVSMTKR
jgi:SAM-dependent methyltransferase